jgi:hypothetical protein
MNTVTRQKSLRLLRQLLCESAPHASESVTLALVALDGKRVVVEFVAHFEEGNIETVTSCKQLHLDRPRILSAEAFEKFWRTFAQRFKPPAAALLCDRATYEGLLEAQEKWTYLAAVAHTQSFYYQLELKT